MQGFHDRRAASSQTQGEAILLSNDAHHDAAHKNGAAGFELRQGTLMNLAWQAMPVCVPERTHMAQEPAWLLRREIEPALLHEQPQAVNHRLPRRAVRLSRLA